MKIAICDDEQLSRNNIKNIIEEKLIDTANFVIEVFDSGELLLNKYYKNPKQFDIIFLDVEMDGINGIETAKQIRQKDNKVIIIFLTSHQEFSLVGYEVKAFRYILKNEPEVVLMKQLDSIFKEYYSINNTFVINYKGSKMGLKIDSIIFFEVFNRKIVAHTQDKEYEFYAKLSDIESQLNQYSFIKTHKSFIVNLVYIDTIQNYLAILKTGHIVSISRRDKKAVENAFVEFLVGG